jgi:hypothetical protein
MGKDARGMELKMERETDMATRIQTKPLNKRETSTLIGTWLGSGLCCS